MGWRTVVVNTHSKLSYKNNHLIFKDAYKTEMIHLSEIDILLLETTDIVLSTMLIKRLVDENILVILWNHFVRLWIGLSMKTAIILLSK